MKILGIVIWGTESRYIDASWEVYSSSKLVKGSNGRSQRGGPRRELREIERVVFSQILRISSFYQFL